MLFARYAAKLAIFYPFALLCYLPLSGFLRLPLKKLAALGALGVTAFVGIGALACCRFQLSVNALLFPALLAGQQTLDLKAGGFGNILCRCTGGTQIMLAQNTAVGNTELRHKLHLQIMCDYCNFHWQPPLSVPSRSMYPHGRLSAKWAYSHS